jgi:hypothetical protein
MAIRPDLKKYRLWIVSLSSFLLGFFIYWNLDSNIVTLIAWLGFFAILGIIETVKLRSIRNHAALTGASAVAMAALGIALISIILLDSDSGNLNISSIFGSQKTFYISGLCMLPMPLRLHPWMAVAGIYVAALALSFSYIFPNGMNSSLRILLLFYIGVLGIGLFSYYQGRSQDLNLPAVIWPAVLCCFLVCDRIMSAPLQSSEIPHVRLLALPFILLVVSLSIRLALNSPAYLKKTEAYMDMSKNENDGLKMDIFIQTLSWLSKYGNDAPQSVLILHPAQSVFYVEGGIHPPRSLPPDQENFITLRQEEHTRKIILSGTARHLFLPMNWLENKQYMQLADPIRSKYSFNEEATLEHWMLK